MLKGLPVLYNRSLLVIKFTYLSVYMLTLASQFIPPHPLNFPLW